MKFLNVTNKLQVVEFKEKIREFSIKFDENLLDKPLSEVIKFFEGYFFIALECKECGEMPIHFKVETSGIKKQELLNIFLTACNVLISLSSTEDKKFEEYHFAIRDELAKETRLVDSQLIKLLNYKNKMSSFNLTVYSKKKPIISIV